MREKKKKERREKVFLQQTKEMEKVEEIEKRILKKNA